MGPYPDRPPTHRRWPLNVRHRQEGLGAGARRRPVPNDDRPAIGPESLPEGRHGRVLATIGGAP